MTDLSSRRSGLSEAKRRLLEERLRGVRGVTDAPVQKTVIRARPKQGSIPLSFAQQRLWFLDQLVPNNPFYNSSGAARLESRLDYVALERSVNEIVRRHEILRTRIEVEAGVPVQVIDEFEWRRLEVEDLTSLTEEEREAAVARMARADAETGFDLSRGPLLRVKVLKVAEEQHVMLWTTHHIVTDGWSTRVMIGELGELYEAFRAGESSPLEELPIQYADYAVWQREWLKGERLERELGYWRKQLTGIADLQLPTDYPRSAARSYRGATYRFQLPPKLVESIHTLNRSRGTTLFMSLLAAFYILLYRYTGQEDIVVGTDVAGRESVETERLIGFFANILALRLDLSGSPSFAELLARVRETTLAAYEHRELPFELLVAELQENRNLSRTPIVQVVFTLQNFSTPKPSDLNPIPMPFDNGTARFDLAIEIEEFEKGLTVIIEYDTTLFKSGAVNRMFDHYRILLAAATANPDTRISALQILTAAESRQLLIEWNQTRCEFARDMSLRELFEAQVERAPEAVAVVFEDLGLTYRELNARANRLARVLREQGVGPEVLVALLAERGVDFLITMLAIFKAGGAYVPLDPHHPPARIGQVLDRSGAIFVIAASRFVTLASEAVAGVNAEDCPPTLILEELLGDTRQPGAPRSEDNLGGPSLLNQLAYVIYTSGSTGAPKGAMVEQKGMLNHLFAKIQDLRLDDRDVVAQTASQCFDISVWQFLAALLAGGRVRIFDDDITYDSASLLDQVESGRITTLEIVPSMMRMMLTEVDHRRVKPNLSALRWLIPTGEALPLDLCHHWFRLYPEIPLLNAYGPTECSDDVTHWPIDEISFDGAARISIGRPIFNTQIYILNAALQPQPVGIVGELYVGGIGVGRGYLKESGKTAEFFAPDDFAIEAGSRLYKTGDLARYQPDGSLECLGRIDHQVKVRGFRIELGEIEAALGLHPGIQESVVAFREDALGEKSLTAYLVAKPEIALSISELRDFLKQKLPEYMAPNAYVMLDSLPLTKNGKLDRRALPAPEMTNSELELGHSAPRTPIEQALAAIWSEVLGVDQIGVYDNFFELGGHSLLATQAVSRVRAAFQVELPLKGLFERPTVSELARSLESVLRTGNGPQAPPLARASREGKLPLSFAQQRLWFIEQLELGAVVYSCSGALRMEGALNLGALESTINEIVRRHEALRTRIEVEDGVPAQVIDAWEPRRLGVEDLSSLTVGEREAEVRRTARKEAETGFDLNRGPLLRVKVLKLDKEEHVAFFTMHHIVSDGWSVGLLLRELYVIYEALNEGKESPLPELEIQYADYAQWQRAWLKGEALEEQVAYWRRQLGGVLPTLELPTDRPRTSAQSYNGANVTHRIGDGLAEGVRTLSRKHGCTLFMTLLGAFQILLSRHSGQQEIVVGTDIANRNQKEIENLIGFFVNQLVMRTDLRGGPNFIELLKRVREVALRAYGRQDVPFEKLVEELQPRRDLSRSPLFQVKLVLQNAPTARAVELPGLVLKEIEEESVIARFDLTLFVEEVGQALAVTANYNRDLFDQASVKRLVEQFETLLESIVENPERRVSLLSIMNEAQRRQIVSESSGDKEEGEFRSVVEMIEEQAAEQPDAIAIVYEGRQVSYGAMNRRANQLGRYLKSRGVEREVVVAVCMRRCPELVVALLGILKAGGAYLPLDPEYPTERLAFMVEDAQTAVMITHEGVSSLPAMWAQTVDLDADWDEIGRTSESDLESVVSEENAIYVIYTSGSSGQPKGVVVTHGGVSNYLKWASEAYRIKEGEGSPVQSSVGFDLTVTSLYGPLISGRRVDLLSENEGIEALGRVLKEEGKYSLVKITPGHLEILAQQLGDDGAEGMVRALVIGGEELKWAGLRYWQERMQGTRLINEYGPTETVVGCCVYEVKENESGSETALIGRPIANTRIYILDEEQEFAPKGGRGEIYISGAGVARGYLGRAELTAERFVPDRYGRGGGERMYRSGDLGRSVLDGNIEFMGRADGQVKVRGYRIEVGEIEAKLNEHPAVRQSVVMAKEEERGGKRLIAYVVVEGIMTGAELRRYLTDSMPLYMAPDAINVVKEMPLTENGKIDRKKLSMLQDEAKEGGRENMAWKTPVEELVVGIFEEVLKVERIGRDDNFFDMGGHSLLATQVASRVREVCGVDIGVKSIFEEPTAGGLARRIEEAMRRGEKSEAAPLARVSREEGAPLSFAQQRLWFIQQLELNNAGYNCPGATRLEGRLNLEALERSVNEIVRRHEVLRTRIEVEAGAPVQVIESWRPRMLEVEDLSRLGMEEREEEARRIAKEEARTGFDLRRGPLMRVKVLRLAEEEHVVLFTMHHIVSDAWSLGVLVREICALYGAFSQGQGSPLPELEIQYADYAYWQRQYLTGAVLEKHLTYWKQQLGGTLPSLELPVDHPRPSIPSYRGATVSFSLSAALSKSLKSLSRQEGVTMFMLTLAAFKTLLHRYTAQEDIIIGTSAENRNRTEIEPLIGFFVNTLPLRTNLSGNPRFRELLRRVKEVALGGYTHQDLPFEKLVEELQPERSVRQMPLFNVAFGVQNAPGEDLKLRDIKIKPMITEQEGVRFDLAIWVTDGLEEMEVSWIYSMDLFEEETVRQMHDNFETLLFSIVDRPDARLANLDISPQAETGLSYKEQDEWEDSEPGQPISTKRRGVNLYTEPV